MELNLIGVNYLGDLIGRLLHDSTVIGRFPVLIQSRIEIEIGPSPDRVNPEIRLAEDYRQFPVCLDFGMR